MVEVFRYLFLICTLCFGNLGSSTTYEVRGSTYFLILCLFVSVLVFRRRGISTSYLFVEICPRIFNNDCILYIYSSTRWGPFERIDNAPYAPLIIVNIYIYSTSNRARWKSLLKYWPTFFFEDYTATKTTFVRFHFS